MAQDSLYGGTPPANAAFVRVIQLGTAATLTIGNTDYGELAFSEVSPYRVILEGSHNLNTSSYEQNVEFNEGRFYTLALGQDEAYVIEDSISTNRAKALLSLYNLSKLKSIDLKTADRKTDILLEVPPMSFKSIEVNGITVDLAILDEGNEVAKFEGRKLERAAAYSVIVLDNETVLWVQSEALID